MNRITVKHTVQRAHIRTHARGDTTTHLEVVLLQLFPPDLVEAPLCLLPLLLFGLEPPQHNGDGHSGTALQTFYDVTCSVTINPSYKK